MKKRASIKSSASPRIFLFSDPLSLALRAAFVFAHAAVLSGCMSLTGLGGDTEFSCPRADGMHCADLETVYRASRDGRLPQQSAGIERLDDGAKLGLEQRLNRPSGSASTDDASGSALKTADGVVRIGSAEASSFSGAPASDAAPAVGPRAAYAQAFGSNVPEAQGFAPRAGDPSAMLPGLEYFASPKRVPEKLVRLWIAPYADDDGDLHDAHALYIRLEDARWATASRRKARGPALVPLPFGSAASTAGESEGAAEPVPQDYPEDSAPGAAALKLERDRLKALLPSGEGR